MHSPSEHLQTQPPALFPRPALVIMLAAFAVVLPLMFLGNPSGHDFEFHLNSWLEVLSQWKQGILYPRWASLAHYGYGEARFVFYPPASWTLGAFLGAVLPWVLVPGIYDWLALTAAGATMFLLARRWLRSHDALFAAVLYAANPYHIIVVYWRSAFAELLASALLPLLLLGVLRAEEGGRKSILPLTLVIAAAWLTNAPSAVIINYSLALLVIVLAAVRRSPRPLFYGTAAVVLGAALAAFYLVPAAYEQKWVNIGEVLSPGLRPQDNFLFVVTDDPDHKRFNLLVSIVAVAELIMLLGAGALSRNCRKGQPTVWYATTAWGATSSLLLFSVTAVLWQHLPKLRYVQLPWRWLLCVSLTLALLLALGTRRWLVRLSACLVLLGVTIAVARWIQPPWWDTAADIAEMRDNMEGPGYEGSDEYVPAGADPYEINREARKVAVQGGGRVRIHVQQWSPEAKFFTADVTEPARLAMRLFNYPAWKVEVNGQVVPAASNETTGQMVIPIEAGNNRVRITFTRTWDRTLGAAISAATVLILLAAVMFSARRRRMQSESAMV